jgi:hypothetical protein
MTDAGAVAEHEFRAVQDVAITAVGIGEGEAGGIGEADLVRSVGAPRHRSHGLKGLAARDVVDLNIENGDFSIAGVAGRGLRHVEDVRIHRPVEYARHENCDGVNQRVS